ncbi:unnamed protein product, partial [Effrenium voratum]
FLRIRHFHGLCHEPRLAACAMPPAGLGKLIASWGTEWLNADALAVPRGPCKMCKACPGFPGPGNLAWPQTDEMEKVTPRARTPLYGVAQMRCERCNCPDHQHQNFEAWLADVKQRVFQIRLLSYWFRPLPLPHFPLAAPSWSRTEAALFLLTEGVFDPRRDRVRRRPLPSPSKDPMISVVAPTSFSRHAFHPLLYQCFSIQEHEPKELVVVDTGPYASAFMEEKAREDPRVIYRHFQVADSRVDLPDGWKQG